MDYEPITDNSKQISRKELEARVLLIGIGVTLNSDNKTLRRMNTPAT